MKNKKTYIYNFRTNDYLYQRENAITTRNTS